MQDDQRQGGDAPQSAMPGGGKRRPTGAQSSTASSPEQAPSWQLPGGRYEVLGEIARGGMGVVLRAIDREVERTLAVKVMLGAPTQVQQQRFLDEARITGQLQHPGVPPVHEIGRLKDGLPFFSMKLIEGHTLGSLLRKRAAPADDLPRFLMIFEQVAQTVAYAHSLGIIHRDLKPANIMVGAFGEVQVMDWGLAKRLGDRRERTAAAAVTGQPAGTVDPTPRSTDAGSRTQDGQIMGTLAYMPPEQAQGEVDHLDQRADVFGLGAILCEILTGKPPYVAKDRMQLYKMATEAQLDRCFARIDAAGADEQLGGLMRRCLAARPDDRPRDADVVARVVTKYLENVQQRLKETEIARAEADVRAEAEQKRAAAEQRRAVAERKRAEEEQKRAVAERKRAEEEQRRRRVERAKARTERQKQRLTLALGGSLVLLLTGLATGVAWYESVQSRQAQQEATRAIERASRDASLKARQDNLNREVSAVLQEAERLREDLHARLIDPRRVHVLLSDINQWKRAVEAARTVWQRADTLAKSDPKLLRAEVADRRRRLDVILKTDEGDFRLAKELDTIRQNAELAIGGEYNPDRAAAQYADTLRKAGYDVETGDVESVARKIRASSIRYALVASLDDWASIANASRILAIARKADDPDPWRERICQSDVWKNPQALQQLADEVDVSRQSPQIIDSFVSTLRLANIDAAPLLRRALDQYPQDYNLHFLLGRVANDPAEKIGSYRAALAIRPDSVPAHCNLGIVLKDKGDLEGAIAHCRRALEIEPNFIFVHVNLGEFLTYKGDLDGAVEHLQKALDIDPNFAPAHFGLGIALKDTGDLEGAIEHYRRALDIEPNLTSAHLNLAKLLTDKGDVEGAIEHLQKALDIEPDLATAHYVLGIALNKKGDLDGAVTNYQRAIENNPQYAEAYCNLADILKKQGKFVEALQALRRGHELGSQREGWPYPSAQWLASAQRRVELDKKLTAVLRGEDAPADASQRLEMASLLSLKKNFADSARFYADAFQDESKLADDLRSGYRYAAARAAALAIAESGERKLGDAKQQTWLKQAREWLAADLQAWTTMLDRNHAAAPSIKRKLQSWQADPDLAAVRDEAALARLPADEQTAWRQLWADVDDLLRRVDSPQA